MWGTIGYTTACGNILTLYTIAFCLSSSEISIKLPEALNLILLVKQNKASNCNCYAFEENYQQSCLKFSSLWIVDTATYKKYFVTVFEPCADLLYESFEMKDDMIATAMVKVIEEFFWK